MQDFPATPHTMSKLKFSKEQAEFIRNHTAAFTNGHGHPTGYIFTQCFVETEDPEVFVVHQINHINHDFSSEPGFTNLQVTLGGHSFELNTDPDRG